MNEAARPGLRLVADIGGTNVRFALARPGGDPEAVCAYRVADHATFGDALDRYRSETGSPTPDEVAIGAAGPVDGGTVTLTNAPWTLAEEALSARLSGASVRIVNDLEAVAHALPHLVTVDLTPIGTGAFPPDPRRPMLAVNIGTGFGAASIAPTRRGFVARSSEPGHMTLAPLGDAEATVFQDRATIEDVLSGRGIADLYRRLAAAGAPALGADQVVAAAGDNADAARTLAIAGTLLGRIAGDLVLATGAWGGCLLCGSVAAGWAGVGDHDAFRAAFERKGPMTPRMAHVYTGLITRGDVALLGLARMPTD